MVSGRSFSKRGVSFNMKLMKQDYVPRGCIPEASGVFFRGLGVGLWALVGGACGHFSCDPFF